MARYVPYDLNQPRTIRLSHADQILEGAFEHALNELVEHHLDLSLFEPRYRNGDTERPAYDLSPSAIRIWVGTPEVRRVA